MSIRTAGRRKRTAAIELLAAAALLAPLGADAAGAAPRTRTESVTELFRATVPAGWSSEPVKTGRRGVRYQGGSATLEVVLRGGNEDPLPTAQAFLRDLRRRGPKLDEVRYVDVAGQRARLWRRGYSLGGAEEAGEWVHEEFVVAPADRGYWVLSFRSISQVPRPEPPKEEREAWDRFLDGFRPG